MSRDRLGATNIGTFACLTFPHDTKACKRAKCCDNPTVPEIIQKLISKYVKKFVLALCATKINFYEKH